MYSILYTSLHGHEESETFADKGEEKRKEKDLPFCQLQVAVGSLLSSSGVSTQLMTLRLQEK